MAEFMPANLALMQFVGVKLPHIGLYEKVRLVETDGTTWKILLEVKIVQEYKFSSLEKKTGVRLVTVHPDGSVDSVRILDKADSLRQVTTVPEHETPIGYRARQEHLTTCYRPGADSRMGQRDGWVREQEGYYLPDDTGNLKWSPAL